jgi:hypothetical protein
MWCTLAPLCEYGVHYVDTTVLVRHYVGMYFILEFRIRETKPKTTPTDITNMAHI